VSASTLEAVAERLIPSDGHGAGAREAQVIRYLERALEDAPRRERETCEQGLAALEAAARAQHGTGFAALAPDRQDALLSPLEGGDFFELVRRHVLEGFFGDPSWGGNAGGAGWALIGYEGPREEWTAEQQRIA